MLRLVDLRFKCGVGGVVAAQGEYELEHAAFGGSANTSEAGRSVDDRSDGPADDHPAVAPALDAASEAADRADEVLDGVRRTQRAFQRARQAQAHHRQRLIESLVEGRRPRRGGFTQTARTGAGQAL